MEVTDRIASLEQRVQMQEDEIQLLKSALADVVRRLNVSEEQQAMGLRRGPTKGKTHRSMCCKRVYEALPFLSVFLSIPLSISTYIPFLMSCQSPLTLLFPTWTVLCCEMCVCVCGVYRPCYDEKVSLSRQQCWEVR